MSTILFVAEWALRSSILILTGALLLQALRVKDPSVRLAAWTVTLLASLAIPALTVMLPRIPFLTIGAAVLPVPNPVVTGEAATLPITAPLPRRHELTPPTAGSFRPLDWASAVLTTYLLVAFVLLLRLCVGLFLARRLLRSSTATGQSTDGIEIRESDRVAAPAALGIVRPAILLPVDWRQWDDAKLNAVLAHERSHIQRFDPALQLLSAFHRAVLWHSPPSWFLHQRIVWTAEESSDDAAVSVTRDRALYAEILLHFMQRGVRGANWVGVPMARYGRPDKRIHRILDGTALSRGATRWAVAAILAVASPLAYLVAAAHPQTPTSAPIGAPSTQQPGGSPREVSSTAAQQAAQSVTRPAAQSSHVVSPKPSPVTLNALGSVAAYTITVKSRIDGQLMSVNFKEGDLVEAGQLLATLDPRPYQFQLTEAESQLEQDQAQLTEARLPQNPIPDNLLGARIAQVEARMKADQARMQNAKLLLSYTRIAAPMSGVAGLALVSPGNVVHAADAGIVIINQLQPIAVLFTIPEDNVSAIRARMKQGVDLPVEAWNRGNTARIATGTLAAVDNQIDPATGTVKLKAVFDNQDGALFPNQFVNVRLRM